MGLRDTCKKEDENKATYCDTTFLSLVYSYKALTTEHGDANETQIKLGIALE
jgi:hypothetical protein